ncbi:MAG: hypothetical protein CMO65_06245 [Verrucomicrobiales bacterium]|nr:hypothetical protein [Verrucomicrobiales bacterium]
MAADHKNNLKMSIFSSKLAFAVVALGLFASSVSQLFAAERSYRVISERNAFNLSNEPPKREEAGPPPEPPRSEDIKLTGIFRHKGIERAAIAVIDPKKKSEPPKYLELAAGEKQGHIEIVSIDKKTGKVTLKELGSLRSLSFETDAFKTSVSKAPSRSSSSKSSSKSSSSRSSSEAAKRSAEIKAAIERRKREDAAKRTSSSSRFSTEQRDQIRATYEQMTRGKSDAQKAEIGRKLREELSRGRSDGGDRGRSDYSRRGRGR